MKYQQVEEVNGRATRPSAARTKGGALIHLTAPNSLLSRPRPLVKKNSYPVTNPRTYPK